MRKELNIKQKRVMIYFITAAKELIESEGVEKLTVRKAAAAAGYNSATLYNYFEDMEELVIFASMGYLKQYIVDLENTLEDSMNALERYRTIYKVFGKTCLKRPEIFYYLFYGKYKKKLKNVISIYYELFPDELGHHDYGKGQSHHAVFGGTGICGRRKRESNGCSDDKNVSVLLIRCLAGT